MELYNNLMICRVFGLLLLILGLFTTLWISMVGIVVAIFAPFIVGLIEVSKTEEKE